MLYRYTYIIFMSLSSAKRCQEICGYSKHNFSIREKSEKFFVYKVMKIFKADFGVLVKSNSLRKLDEIPPYGR
jgi:hypothetical protein